MRPLLAAAIWIILVGGLAAYMHGRDQALGIPEFRQTSASGDFALEATTSFAVEPDPFALQVDEATKPPALVVKLNGKSVLLITERLEAGTPIVAEKVGGIVEGPNELYVEANPPLEMAGKSHAIRVRLLRGGHTIAEKSFWSEPGSKIATTFTVNVGPAQAVPEDDHGH